METPKYSFLIFHSNCPHSLGTLIEWKHTPVDRIKSARPKGPHSLGTLIEWKLHKFIFSITPVQFCPHSLGTLIEWKLFGWRWWIKYYLYCPHSLGTLIEWKHIVIPNLNTQSKKSPLAGDINWMETFSQANPTKVNLSCPHSLGTLIEWKLPYPVQSRSGYAFLRLSPLAGDINWMETKL